MPPGPETDLRLSAQSCGGSGIDLSILTDIIIHRFGHNSNNAVSKSAGFFADAGEACRNGRA